MPHERVVAVVQELKQKLNALTEREIRRLLFCLHTLPADQCGDCKGMTALGVPMDAVVEELKRQGFVDVELVADLPHGEGPPIRHRRITKSLVGIGIGVSFFLGVAGWQGGKILLRLIKKDSGAAPSTRA